MNITKEEVQRLIEAFHADPHTADWDDALSLLRAKRDEKDAEPVAWRRPSKYGGWAYEDGITSFEHDPSSVPLYEHPAHDDTALLRMALEALNNSTPVLGDYQDENAEAQQKHIAAITALRERLGETG